MNPVLLKNLRLLSTPTAVLFWLVFAASFVRIIWIYNTDNDGMIFLLDDEWFHRNMKMAMISSAVSFCAGVFFTVFSGLLKRLEIKNAE